MSKSKARPLCPKCGEPLCRGGSTRGIQRYRHKPSYQKICAWNGTQPVDRKVDEDRGIDAKATKAFHRAIRSAKGVQRYVITAAQNATPVNKKFLASLIGYCNATGAQPIVIPYRYKNPTSHWGKAAESDDWWAPELQPFLLDRRVDLNGHLTLLADIKTQPTATAPLQGFETLTGNKSAIVGHPKLELTTVPTPQARLPKILSTTGAVTERNYIAAKAGKKAEHHHTFGASVVEIVGKRFHLRQINAVKDGSFIDLDREYDGDDVRPTQAAGLVMGDSHVEFIDPSVVKATFESDSSIIGVLRPKELVWHDVHDFYSRNHHHKHEFFINYVKHHTGHGNVERALDGTFAFIDKVSAQWPSIRNIFVSSNHPDALARWVKETDPRTDPENCVFWAQTFEAMCRGAGWTDTGARTIDPFAYWAMKKLKSADRAKFLGGDESHVINGIELSYHGHIGPAGVRGSRSAFGKIGVKTVIGHGHAPGVKDGVYQTGTSSRFGLEYARGPSGWLHTHCGIYANGKRSLINIIDGEWRAP